MNNFNFKINVAEEETSDNHNDGPCEHCQSMFNFHNDIRYSMFDPCLFSIAKKENINLKFRYQCEICSCKFKTEHSSVYTNIVSFKTVPYHSSLKSAKQIGRVKNLLKNTCIRSTTCITVSVVCKGLRKGISGPAKHRAF